MKSSRMSELVQSSFTISGSKSVWIFSCIGLESALHYRKRGSASYIVREWLLWVVERERERRLWRHLISHWNREWSCIWLPRRRVDPTRRRVLQLSLSSARVHVHVKTRSLALERSSSRVEWDWWMTIGKGKLCVRWSACRGSPSSISLACFKQEE